MGPMGVRVGVHVSVRLWRRWRVREEVVAGGGGGGRRGIRREPITHVELLLILIW